MDQQNKQQKQEQELQQLKSIFKKNDPQNHIQPLSQILKKFIPQFRKTFGQSSQNPQNPPDHPQDLQKQQKFLQFITSCKLLEKPKGEFLYHFQEKIKHVYIILQGQVAIWVKPPKFFNKKKKFPNFSLKKGTKRRPRPNKRARTELKTEKFHPKTKRIKSLTRQRLFPITNRRNLTSTISFQRRRTRKPVKIIPKSQKILHFTVHNKPKNSKNPYPW